MATSRPTSTWATQLLLHPYQAQSNSGYGWYPITATLPRGGESIQLSSSTVSAARPRRRQRQLPPPRLHLQLPPPPPPSLVPVVFRTLSPIPPSRLALPGQHGQFRPQRLSAHHSATPPSAEPSTVRRP